MIRSEGSTIAAQLHVDDTYLPTNKQPPPSSINHHCVIVLLVFEECVVCCGCGFDSNATTSSSVQNRFKKEERKNTNGINYSLRSSTIH